MVPGYCWMVVIGMVCSTNFCLSKDVGRRMDFAAIESDSRFQREASHNVARNTSITASKVASAIEALSNVRLLEPAKITVKEFTVNSTGEYKYEYELLILTLTI